MSSVAAHGAPGALVSAGPADAAAEPAHTPGAEPRAEPADQPPVPRQAPNPWRRGEVAMQGYFGASFYEVSRDQNGGLGDVYDADTTLPTIGGGAQWKLAGDRVDFGLEALLGFAGRGNVSAFASGPGGTLVAVDIDLLVFELYGGPFVNMFLGPEFRVYVGAGPLMEWASYDQNGPSGLSDSSGSGFGVGYYARTGFEFMVARGTMIGLGARWTDATVDLDGGLGDLDVHGFEALFTVSRGF